MNNLRWVGHQLISEKSTVTITIDLECPCGAKGSVTVNLDGETRIGTWLKVACDCDACKKPVELTEQVGVLLGRSLQRKQREEFMR